MSKQVTKAVIAAAGFGTRFLPQTKAMPKEMFPLGDMPIIQRVVEELVGAGIKDIIIVSNYAKRSIEDHFDTPSAELAAALIASGKLEQLKDLQRISDMANFVYVRQKMPMGNAAPLFYTKHLINDEPFIYTWADDFIDATPSRFQQMITAYNTNGGSIVSCVRIQNDDEYDRFGIVSGEPSGKGMLKMASIIEKPGKANAPSNLGSVSSYLFNPEILTFVDTVAATHVAGVEDLSIQSAMQLMIDSGYAYYALEIANGIFRDTGNKLEYLKAVVEYALKRDDIGPAMRAFLEERLKNSN
jgi:UTP--glucose-1-phosphate uridylyltransferase